VSRTQELSASVSSDGLGSRLRAAGETKVTLSYANVPVADGSAQVPDIAVHVGVGLRWSGSILSGRTNDGRMKKRIGSIVPIKEGHGHAEIPHRSAPRE
jgi:hypothetical protein